MTINITTPEKPFEVRELELSGETALCVHCARLHLSEKRIRAISDSIRNGIDWNLLLRNAAWHRLAPLVSYHLSSSGLRRLVPDRIMARLQNAYNRSLARNIIMQYELHRIISTFNREGISLILLKGSALLGSVYQDIGLRPMNDLDFLVSPADLDRAEELALDLGYVHTEDTDDVPADVIKHHLLPLVNRTKNVVIEIHRHIVDSDDAAYFDIADFRLRSRPVRKGNAEARALRPEDMIAHLCIKFLSERRFQSVAALGQLCDISETIKHYDGSLDWDLVIRVAQEKRFTPVVFYVLYACQRIIGTPVPAPAMQRLCPSRFDKDFVDLFLRRRILDTRLWLAHGLVKDQTPYTRRRMLRSVAGRVFKLAVEPFEKKGRTSRGRFPSLTRIKAILPNLTRGLVKPSELKEDLLLDRWLHDIYTRTQ